MKCVKQSREQNQLRWKHLLSLDPVLSFTAGFIINGKNENLERQINNTVLLEKPPPPFFDQKLVYSYVIELADFESDLGFFSTALVSEIMVFLRIRVTCIFFN